MKKFLLIIFASVYIFAAQPIQYGAYFGDIKVSIKNYSSYPSGNASSAGTLYLYKQKKNDLDYIYETEQSHRSEGLKEAKELAIKNNNKYFAIDNVSHQVVVTENKVMVISNYNVLSFD